MARSASALLEAASALLEAASALLEAALESALAYYLLITNP